MDVNEQEFDAIAESNDWVCERCERRITHKDRETFYEESTGLCSDCASEPSNDGCDPSRS